MMWTFFVFAEILKNQKSLHLNLIEIYRYHLINSVKYRKHIILCVLFLAPKCPELKSRKNGITFIQTRCIQNNSRLFRLTLFANEKWWKSDFQDIIFNT